MHPSAAYAYPYETAESLFGKEMSPSELIGRVRTFSWQGSLFRLANLAAIVSNEPGGPRSERIRRLTVEPIKRLTGATTYRGILARARLAVEQRRNRIVLAHEEAISFLQHLVLLEGGDSAEAPGDPEITLWLAGVNGHLARWAEQDAVSLSEKERLAAELVRISRFNARPDALRALVRTYRIFGRKPSTGSLADNARWNALARLAYPEGFEASFEAGLGLIAMLAAGWGTGRDKDPILNLDRIGPNKRATAREQIAAALRGFVATRQELQAEIKKRMRPDGLPHSPTALYHTPLVRIEPGVLLASSPWAVIGLLRTGVWARFLQTAKAMDERKGATEWLSAFGYLFEDWCREVASRSKSKRCRAEIILPSAPGADDEVEDVVILDDGVAVFCSAKSRLVEARVAREAVSPGRVISWMEKFFFEEKVAREGREFRGGAVRQLSRRIDMLRRGEFEGRGLAKEIPVVPVVVTYDSLGESVLTYRWLEEESRKRGLLQQQGVGPLALARVEEFELLLSRVARGKPVARLLLGRQGRSQHRRLDQLLYEAEPSGPRLPFFESEFRTFRDAITSRLFEQASAPP